MIEFTERHWPDFVTEYELVYPEKFSRFPGSIMNFSYEESPNISQICCDVFPKFKKSHDSTRSLDRFKRIPHKGVADMWIISTENRREHLEKLSIGQQCFLFVGTKMVVKCSIIKLNL